MPSRTARRMSLAQTSFWWIFVGDGDFARHIAFGFALYGVDQDDALPALNLASAAQEVRGADQDVRVHAAGQRFGQQGAYTVVTHQRVAESDDEQRLLGRRTRWEEQEIQETWARAII